MIRKISLLYLGLLLMGCFESNQTTQETDDNIVSSEDKTENISLKQDAPPIKDPAWLKDSPPPNHYSDDWHIGWGWSGEYPNGFSVLKENVQLKARTKPDPTINVSLDCNLDYLGMYQQWNPTRNHELLFFTASETYKLEVNKTSEVEVFINGKTEPKTFYSGDELKFLTYHSEGWALVEVDGIPIELSIVDLYLKENWGDDSKAVHEWIGIPCDDKIGWVLFSDVINRNDTANYGYSLSSWGYAQDISHEDAKELQEIVLQERTIPKQ